MLRQETRITQPGAHESEVNKRQGYAVRGDLDST